VKKLPPPQASINRYPQTSGSSTPLRADEEPVTAFRKSDLPEGAPVIHSFIVHPDGSVQDMKRYSNKQTAETVSEIRDSLQDLK